MPETAQLYKVQHRPRIYEQSAFIHAGTERKYNCVTGYVNMYVANRRQLAICIIYCQFAQPFSIDNTFIPCFFGLGTCMHNMASTFSLRLASSFAIFASSDILGAAMCKRGDPQALLYSYNIILT